MNENATTQRSSHSKESRSPECIQKRRKEVTKECEEEEEEEEAKRKTRTQLQKSKSQNLTRD